MIDVTFLTNEDKDELEQKIEDGGASSWNDLTDKPFGETKEVVEILPETHVESAGQEHTIATPTEGLTLGETYIVKYNGVEYECVAQDGSSAGADYGYCLGNVSFFSGEASTGEPFMVCAVLPEAVEVVGFGVVVMTVDEVTEFTISIRGEQTTIVPIDGKFLPEGVPYIEDGGMVEILPECQPTYFESEQAFILTEGAPSLTVGDTYIVNFNGTEYTCVGQNLPEFGVGLGDASALGFPSNGKGEPFVIVVSGGMLLTVPLDGAETVTLSIKHIPAIIHKIDERCLPNNVVNDIVVVTLTLKEDSSYIASHTGEELCAEIDGNRKAAVLLRGGMTIPCIGVNVGAKQATFSNVYWDENSNRFYRSLVTVDADGTLSKNFGGEITLSAAEVTE